MLTSFVSLELAKLREDNEDEIKMELIKNFLSSSSEVFSPSKNYFRESNALTR
jgi:hypothetical protein